jgi:hypothetical protein
MSTTRLARYRRRAAGMEPLSPQRKWRAITVATLLLVPAYWAILAGVVTTASDKQGGVANPGAAIALGFMVIPFVFIALAFLSEHPMAASAVVKAMGLCLLVGIPVSAIAGDAITGMVAGVGAGGVVALRADEAHNRRARVIAVVLASLYTLVLARTAGAIVLLTAPSFPFPAIGVADHLSERRREREASAASPG